MIRYNILQAQNGFVMLWMAIFLPIAFAMALFVIDLGLVYTRKIELQNLTQAAVQSALIELGLKIEARAEEVCDEEEAPETCEGGNVFAILSSSQVEAIIDDTQAEIFLYAKSFAYEYDKNDPPIDINNIVLSYSQRFPGEYVGLEANVTMEYSPIFSVVSDQDLNIRVLSKLPLQ